MINHIDLIRNIGTFDSDSPPSSADFKKISLMYADNARGKTTLAAIFRSLASGISLPIEERKRIGSSNSPHVVIDWGNPADKILYQNQKWTHSLPDLKIFDDLFVDENVYSGLDVEPQHRQNLHELILGDKGVALNRRLQELVTAISEHNKRLTENTNAIPAELRGDLSVDAFCSLPQISNVDAQIEEEERNLRIARDQESLLNAQIFTSVELPGIALQNLDNILSLELQDLNSAAETSVTNHLINLGNTGESWLADGMTLLAQTDEDNCPFCGQDIRGLELVAHFKAYFSEEYTQLKNNVAAMISEIGRDHGGGTQAEFERAVSSAKEAAQFWSAYCDVPQIGLDTQAISLVWISAREAITKLLEAKQVTPLEKIAITPETRAIVAEYEQHPTSVVHLNQLLKDTNQVIEDVKEKAAKTSATDVDKRLVLLKATKARHTDDIDALCEAYLLEKQAKSKTEIDRDQTRGALTKYRNEIFPTLEKGVNEYLERFNAGFRIRSLNPTNIGGGSGASCTFNIEINNTAIAVSGGNTEQGKPSFRNTLSSGDRNTLALALFFSTLDQNPNIQDTVVIIDDPMSSLDDHRSLATIQTVRGVAGRVRQVVALSHNKQFLCQVWNGANQVECSGLEIVQAGKQSNIVAWDISEDAVTEHDRRHTLLKEFAELGSGDHREVAISIRPHLEGFLRVACPAEFPPKRLLNQSQGEKRRGIG